MKGSERTQAVALRHHGATYQAIMDHLRVSKSTLWRWLKAEGLVETESQRLTELKRAAQRKGAARVKANYLARTKTIIEQARQEVEHLSKRDLWMLGVALYWAEGSKQKPYNVAQRVAFSNSDPAMVQLFLKWLKEICQIPRERLGFELFIHQSANVEAARQFWSSALQVSVEWLSVRLKRHNVSPRRRNIGKSYVGLVRVTVRQSAALNRKIAGWIEGLARFTGESAKGKPGDFGSPYPGSSPGSPALLAEPGVQQNRLGWVLQDRVNGGIDRIQ